MIYISHNRRATHNICIDDRIESSSSLMEPRMDLTPAEDVNASIAKQIAEINVISGYRNWRAFWAVYRCVTTICG